MHRPAWHPDPTTPGQERWWDGQSFTEHVRPAATPVAAAVPGTAWSPAGPADAPAYRYASSVPTYPAPGNATGAAPLHPTAAPRGMFADVARQADIRADLASGKNSHANLGFIFALLSVVGVALGWVIGIIFGILGLRRARKYAEAGYPAIGRRKAIWALALSGVGIAVTGFLVYSAIQVQQPRLTSTEVERVVATQFTEQTGVAAQVRCPEASRLGTGDLLTCMATVPGGAQHLIEVTVHDDAGAFTWTGHAQ